MDRSVGKGFADSRAVFLSYDANGWQLVWASGR